MNLYLASGNAHKAQEMQVLARSSGLALTIHSAREVGGMPEVVEDTGTFIGNATKKARALAERVPAAGWVMADDSGLGVAALGGRPGVESAYYAGPEGDGAANLAKLTQVMREVPEGERAAWFTCVLVVRGPDGTERVFEGRCDGRLGVSPAGGAGFGYDPLFIPEGEGKTFAELGEEVKSRLSHRAKAWAQFAAWWRETVA